jgi:arylsulfatase A-like enzyme
MAESAKLGAIAWLAYFAVEYLLTTTYRLPVNSEEFIGPNEWRTAIYLLVAFLVAGLAMGIAAGSWFNSESRRRIAVSLGLLTGQALSLLSLGKPLTDHPHLYVTLLLMAALALMLWRDWDAQWVRLVSSPWVLSLLLIFPSWFRRESYIDSFTVGAIAKLGLLASLIAVARVAAGSRRGAMLEGAAAVLLIFAAGTVNFVVSGRRQPVLDASIAQAQPNRPNVLWIVWDTVRADRTTVYGYGKATTPKLAEFARGATVYKRAISTANWTLASHASMLTGLYTGRHGCHPAQGAPDGKPLPEEITTIAEVLRGEGYRTAAVVANHAYMDRRFDMNQGFELYDVRRPVPYITPAREHYLSWGLKKFFNRVVSSREFDMTYRPGDAITADAAKLATHFHQEQRPFFLFLNMMDAHDPLTPPGEFADRFPGRLPGVEYMHLQDARALVHKGQMKMPEAYRRHLDSQYDGGIAYLDFVTAQLFETLKQQGLYDNTMIIVTSDHGEALGEHNFYGHPVSMEQNQIHVPLLVKYPGEREGAQVDALASGVDLMPTVLRAAGSTTTPPPTDGRDLRAGEEKPVFSDGVPPLWIYGRWGKTFQRRQHAVFTGDTKFVVSTNGRAELSHPWTAAADPPNEFREDDPIVKQFEPELRARAKKFTGLSRKAGERDKRELEHLKSLGYAQ